MLGLAGIGQLADACRPLEPGLWEVEIRIALDIVEPPAARLWVVRYPGQAHHPGSEQGIEFTGWLGLLRALYEVTAAPGGDRCRACPPGPQ